MENVTPFFNKLLKDLGRRGVYIISKNGLGQELYVSSGLPESLRNEDALQMPIIYDGKSGRYFYRITMKSDDDLSNTIVFDVTRDFLDYISLKEKVHDLEKTIEDLKIDSTTGLMIRSHTLKEIGDYVKYANLNNEPYAIVIADLDYFKRINDNYGHVIGDKTLRMVADTLKKSMRQTPGEATRKKDIIGRYGGEEFIILLKNIKEEDIFNVVDRMRKNIAEKRFSIKNKDEYYDISITISCGVCHSHNGQLLLDDAILQADSALYESKENGRNCTTVRSDCHQKKIKK